MGGSQTANPASLAGTPATPKQAARDRAPARWPAPQSCRFGLPGCAARNCRIRLCHRRPKFVSGNKHGATRQYLQVSANQNRAAAMHGKGSAASNLNEKPKPHQAVSLVPIAGIMQTNIKCCLTEQFNRRGYALAVVPIRPLQTVQFGVDRCPVCAGMSVQFAVESAPSLAWRVAKNRPAR